MAKRIYRELPQEIRDKISAGMKKHHKEMGYDDKKKMNKKKSDSLKQYWNAIPNKSKTNDTGDVTIYDIML